MMALSHILVMLISQHSLPSQIMEGTIFDIVYLQKYFSPRMSNEEVLFPPPDNLQHVQTNSPAPFVIPATSNEEDEIGDGEEDEDDREVEVAEFADILQ